MDLVISPSGQIRAIYDDNLDLRALGQLDISRASHVEPDEQGQWWADLAPVRGPKLGPFAKRTQALGEELRWLEQHWLPLTPGP